MEKVKDTSSTATVVVFLVLEVLAFVSFSLGNSIALYSLLGLVTLAVLAYASFKDIKTKGYSYFGIFMIPLLVFGILVAVGGFSSCLRRLDAILIPFALLIFAGIGYFVTATKEFKFINAFLVIYGALALLVLITWGYTMIQFKPFYTITLRNSYFYYDGQISPVPIGKMAFFLVGFDFIHVSLEYFMIFPTLLASSVIALIFLSPKKDKRNFFIFLAYAIIGFLPLITMPSKMGILTDVGLLVVVLLVFLFGKLKLNKKILMWLGIGFGTIFAFLLFILFLCAVSQGFHDAIASNAVLNRIFLANGLCARYFEILNIAFTNGILGFDPGATMIYGGDVIAPGNSWLFDNSMISGPIGAVLFIIAIVMGFVSVVKYCLKSKEQVFNKSLLVGFLVVFLGYSLIAYDMKPYCYYNLEYIPMAMSGPFLVCCFLFGATFIDAFDLLAPSKEDVAAKSAVENITSNVVDVKEINDTKEEEITL